MNELALFSGIGGCILGGTILGWRTRCAVEIDAYCRAVLLSRQRDGVLPRFPIWDDVRTFNGNTWRGHIDVVSGGFPCQDISSAGRREGIGGSRSGLWFEMQRIIGEVRPTFAFIENSPHLRTRGLNVVINGLACMGYDCRWGVLGAWHASGPHKRNRIWIAARLTDADDYRKRVVASNAEMAVPQTARTRISNASDADRISLWQQCGGGQQDESERYATQ